ncbi:Acyl-CoA-binding domain-containing protein 1 [Gracilariopsis chorda]|uniref:Acyl-CoA-binding domain-containing protein 1 n=1 Tax=Gracilariopsis chorda TaxID=448386 RepID=A0A2V3IC68_9FLOR|nr:Acyl-CoA-binding domain-containing protein 1 [Gracilariopsis chorda]|eukprot:PXF39702.1 Acyl-CoA-binding domain-containing protein 1 [Gracilariopsis chorda]
MLHTCSVSDVRSNSASAMTTAIVSSFEDAADFVSSGKLGSISQDEQLELYGLYSVVRKGSAPNKAPSALLDPTGFAKWTAWQTYSHLEKEDAMKEYIELVSSLLASSRPKTSSSTQSTGFGNKGSGGFDIQADNEELSNNELDICYYATMGDKASVIRCLKKQRVSPNYRDQDGLTPLMRAVDRNEMHVVDILVAAGADLNAVDDEGQTALHYAVCCDYSEMTALLLYHGARTDIVDKHGDGALGIASDETKRAIEEVQQGTWKRKSPQFNVGRWWFSYFSPVHFEFNTQVLAASAFITVGIILYYHLRQ